MLNKVRKNLPWFKGQHEPVLHKVFVDDLFLVSFPKSGNTWISFLLGNLLAEYEGKGVEINFFNVQDYIPEYDTPSHSLRRTGISGFPRILKSHSPCNYLFPKVFLLLRDPRDVMVSYYHYLKGLGCIPESWTVGEMVNSGEYGIRAWIDHTRGWLERADRGKRTRVFRYEEFLDNTASTLRRMFEVLGCSVDSDLLQRAVDRSGFEQMKRLEKTTRTPDFPLKESSFRFVRKGVAAGGRELPDHVRNDIETEADELMRLLHYK